jgi:hypothetical protein
VAHAFNPSTWEAESLGISEFEASLVYKVSSRETLSGKKKKKKRGSRSWKGDTGLQSKY